MNSNIDCTLRRCEIVTRGNSYVGTIKTVHNYAMKDQESNWYIELDIEIENGRKLNEPRYGYWKQIPDSGTVEFIRTTTWKVGQHIRIPVEDARFVVVRFDYSTDNYEYYDVRLVSDWEGWSAGEVINWGIYPKEVNWEVIEGETCMGHILAKQPNGKFSIWSTVVENWLATDLTEDQTAEHMMRESGACVMLNNKYARVPLKGDALMDKLTKVIGEGAEYARKWIAQLNTGQTRVFSFDRNAVLRAGLPPEESFIGFLKHPELDWHDFQLSELTFEESYEDLVKMRTRVHGYARRAS